MSVYLNFILILSKFHPDKITINLEKSKSNFDKAKKKSSIEILSIFLQKRTLFNLSNLESLKLKDGSFIA